MIDTITTLSFTCTCFLIFAAGCRFSSSTKKHSSPGIIDYVLDRLAPIVKRIMVYEKKVLKNKGSLALMRDSEWMMDSGYQSRAMEADGYIDGYQKSNADKIERTSRFLCSLTWVLTSFWRDYTSLACFGGIAMAWIVPSIIVYPASWIAFYSMFLPMPIVN